MHVTVFTVIGSLPTNHTSLKCGQKLGVAGKLPSFYSSRLKLTLLVGFFFLIFLYIGYTHIKRFTEFGGTVHKRPVQDLAFAVARFIQTGGSYFNYYMVRC